MASREYIEVMKQADELSTEEKLLLISHLAEQARLAQVDWPRYKWSDIEGALPYPMFGEDAQEWVSRTRREADEQREPQWMDPQ